MQSLCNKEALCSNMRPLKCYIVLYSHCATKKHCVVICTIPLPLKRYIVIKRPLKRYFSIACTLHSNKASVETLFVAFTHDCVHVMS